MNLSAERLERSHKPDKRRDAGEATRERLMSAAELLFAELGYEGTSTRALAQAAGADLAMIVYQLGSKLGLYREILMRRAKRLNAARLQDLDEVLVRSPGQPELADVVRALVATNIRLRTDPELGGLPVARLIARQLLDPNDAGRHLIGDMFDELAVRFIAAIRLALPAADAQGVYWGFHFAISAMVQAMANVNRQEALSRGTCDMKDSEEVMRGWSALSSAASMPPWRKCRRPLRLRPPSDLPGPPPPRSRPPPASHPHPAGSGRQPGSPHRRHP